mmetsp:Transcript_87393/g.173448  ORF Transcript_87393/g.173448 Transcript_87393/m.173448 type:complete len:226 (-) Transcript_87393:224-901(-)
MLPPLLLLLLLLLQSPATSCTEALHLVAKLPFRGIACHWLARRHNFGDCGGNCAGLRSIARLPLQPWECQANQHQSHHPLQLPQQHRDRDDERDVTALLQAARRDGRRHGSPKKVRVQHGHNETRPPCAGSICLVEARTGNPAGAMAFAPTRLFRVQVHPRFLFGSRPCRWNVHWWLPLDVHTWLPSPCWGSANVPFHVQFPGKNIIRFTRGRQPARTRAIVCAL